MLAGWSGHSCLMKRGFGCILRRGGQCLPGATLVLVRPAAIQGQHYQNTLTLTPIQKLSWIA
jgi:hypothetical protein